MIILREENIIVSPGGLYVLRTLFLSICLLLDMIQPIYQYIHNEHMYRIYAVGAHCHKMYL